MAEVGSAFVSILPSAKGFGRTLESGISRDVDGAAKRTGGRFGKVFATATVSPIRAIGAAAVGIFAGQQIAGFFKTAIAGASDLEESSTKISAIFGDAAGQVQKFASQGATALGQTKLAVLDASATFGTFGKAAGLSGAELAKFSTGFASLSTDLASFYNSTPEQAVEAIGAALRGEAEPMRQFGVLLDDATLRNEALKLGLISTTKQALTPQQKVLAAQAAIYKQTADAQGDFQRTSGGLANQQRILSAQFSDLRTSIGVGLLPITTRFVTYLNATAVPAARQFFTEFKTGVGVGGQVRDILVSVGSAFMQAGQFIVATVGFINQHRTAAIALTSALVALVAITRIHAAVLAVQAAGGLLAMVKALPIVTALTRTYAAVQWVLNAALTANPIGIVVVAVAALVAGMVVAYKRSETFRGIVNTLWAALKVAGQWVVDVAKKVAAFGAEVGGPALSKVRAFASFMLGAYVGSIRAAIGVIGNIIGAIGRFGAALIDGIQAAARFASGVIEKAGQVVQWFSQLPGKILGALAGLAGRLYNAGAEMMNMLAAGIRDRFSAAWDAMKSAASKLASLIPGSPVKEGPLKSLNNGHSGGQIMALLAKGIKDGQDEPAEAMGKAVEKLRDKLIEKRDEIRGVLDGLKSDFASLSQSVSQAFTGNLFDATNRSDFLWNLTNTRDRLRNLKDAFQKLLGWGMSPQFLSQLFSSGNGALIMDLAAGTRTEARTSQQLFGQVNSLSTSLGNQVARADIGPKIDRTNAKLDKVIDRLERLPKNLGRELNSTAAGVARGR